MATDIQDFLKAGNDILNSVTSAMDRNDFSTLRTDINKAVKSVSIDRKVMYSSGMGGQQVRTAPKPQRIIPFLQRKISRYLGVPQMVFAAPFGLFFMFIAIALLASEMWIPGIVTTAIAFGSLFVMGKGKKKYDLARKYYRYGAILKDAEYFNISDLAKAAMESDKTVLDDIKRMMKLGFIPRARLDSTETVCMVTDKAYEQYLGAEQDRAAREAREAQQKAAAAEAVRAKNAEYANLPTQAVEILEEGKEYIQFVKQVNDKIPDTEDMSDKLYRLEEIMNRIFAQVKKDPDSADDLHKLMNYYLPTTKKLLNAYVELDKQPEVGDNITQTKREIDGAMDTINMAFENLLDSLFQDMAWDISSDISVMKTMMAQDGLTQEGQAFSTQTQTQAQVQTQGNVQTLSE